MTEKRWRCECCDETSLESELLTAPSPFDPEETLTGCPRCLSADGFEMLCEIGDCQKTATCGGPALDGVYRQTCGAHADWLHQKGRA